MNYQAVIHDDVGKRWLHFHDARQVVTAVATDAVVPALDTVVELVNGQGLYAAGFIGYEASPAFDPAFKVRQSSSFPLLWFGLYTTPEIIAFPDELSESSDFEFPSASWTPSIDRADYNQAIRRIKDYIAGGETYQVNYTYRLHTPFSADAWPFFLRIARAQQAEYAAYIDTGRFVVCSASPELFFRLDGNALTACPMKGTAPRGLTLHEDKKRAEWLNHSEKNRAENIMIVDMVRNDMGRIASTGTVSVPRLFDIERYPTVWQMTSTVTAESAASITEIVRALFPCASITGAPKPHTTEIIAELETTPRNIYTGCIGFIAPERKAQFSVAIRTVLVDRETKQAEYGVGGGIVWDSSSSEEYEECRVKALVLMKNPVEFSLLETMLWTPDEGYFLLDYHLRRVRDSAEYFGIPAGSDHILDTLKKNEESLSPRPYKVRMLISGNGAITCENTLLEGTTHAQPVRLRLASAAVDPSNPFLYHKTTNRELYTSAKSRLPDCDDTLLWNTHGEITETTIANIVIRHDGELVTPPVSCGLLPGTYRAWLIERKEVIEKIVTVEDIERCDALYVINSVRKMREAILIPDCVTT